MTFERQFVYFDWDENLVGKKVFAADNIRDLKALVVEGHPDERVTVLGYGGDTYPFSTSLYARSFVYYDPAMDADDVTNRDLAMWLAEGKGEVLLATGLVAQSLVYDSGKEDEAPTGIKIRKWSDTEWHTPTKAYME